MYWNVFRAAREKKDAGQLENFEVVGLWAQEDRVVTVHMHNPFVLETDIYAFLSRYVEILNDGWMLRDGVRVWTGRWQYRVRFQPDNSSKDGFRHPPANFFLGSNQGYLFYAGQPKLCRRCGGEGHLVANCTKMICRRCGKEGHEVRDCEERPRCSLCNEAGHLFKDC
ncbi:ZCHC3 protein, partial [Atractosteus spatula]|nr:ZCHC3 protein [Atractosteus spatula]